jgi:cytochrome c peroxidase
MCHVPEQGFTSNELSMAVGLEGRSVRRNSPTIYNVAYFEKLFHDGRENSLEQQIWGPLLARNEMANPSVGYVIEKIKKIPDYQGMFEKAFKGTKVNMQNLSEALASYQRTLISADSPFDRWHFGKQQDAISDSAKKGYQLFVGKARCVSCHQINKDYALFTDNKLHNTGIGYNESMGIRPEKERVILAPGVFVEVDTSIIDSVGEKTPADTGLYEITQNPDDRWKYRTPSLRNISLTAPYMHNGSLRSLEAVVSFYNKGGIKNLLQDPLISPLNLSEQEQSDLVSFLKSLTGSNVDTLVSDAFAAPIGDLTHKDPNWAHKEAKGSE